MLFSWNIVCYFADDQSASQECTTLNGALCILPFRYNGDLFETCVPNPGTTDYWCATAVGSNEEFFNIPGTWGTCGPNCPTSKSEITATIDSSFEKNSSPKDTIEFQSKEVAWRRKFYHMIIISYHWIYTVTKKYLPVSWW